MKRRFVQKRDQSEAAIVKALKDAGCDVERGTDCDLYVGYESEFGQECFLIECKTPGPNAKRRQPIQKRLQAIFGPDQYKVVTSPEEALKAVGIAS